MVFGVVKGSVMSVGLLGRKIGMTQVYEADGTIVPVSVIKAGPCVVLQKRTVDNDGYEAVQVGFEDKPRRLASRAERGHVAEISSKRQKQRASAGAEAPPKPNCEPKRFVREFRTDGEQVPFDVGHELTVTLFKSEKVKKDEKNREVKDAAGNTVMVPVYVDVIGTTKGRGTAGVMKRHNFAGQRASHGVKKVHRHAGSMSAHGTNRGFSGDIRKGKRMAGRYGVERVTIRNLRVVRIDEENGLLIVEGAVPGPNGGYLQIRPTNKARNAIPQPVRKK